MEEAVTFIGKHIHELDTPALLLDLAAMERNSARMREFLSGKKVNLRPHVKLHRATPEIAHFQIVSGAIGLTCSKLSEAEALASAGINNILIANQIASPFKIDRLAQLASRCIIIVAVDSIENIKALSLAAVNHSVTIGILVEVNIGHNRCGSAPYQPSLDLVRVVCDSPGLQFKGLMGYDGHCTLKVNENERESLSIQANTLLAKTAQFIENEGIKVEIVSGGGTFTYRYAADVEGITEVQAGTYLLMDTGFRDHGVREFESALSVLTTVISRPTYPGAEGLIIIDTGQKSVSTTLGNPEVKSPVEARVISLSDEHGRVRLDKESDSIKIGDKIELWVRDANGTINHFNRFYAVRDQIVEAVWSIPLSGDHT